MRRSRTKRLLTAAALGAAVAATAAGPGAASEYTDSVARKTASEIVYVDPKAEPGLSTSEAGEVRLRIAKQGAGRIKIAVVPEARADDEGGVAGFAQAMASAEDFPGALLVVAGDGAQVLTSHPDSDGAVSAVQKAFNRNKGDLEKQLLRSVDGLADADPGPSADSGGGGGGAPAGLEDFDEQTDGIFDSVNDAIRTTTLIIAAFFIIPILAGIIWIALRIRSSRKEAAGDLDFAQEGLRNQLVELGDEIRELDVDTSMPDANRLALADYEAAVKAYDRANNALQRSEQNPRYVPEAKAALAEGKRKISDAKVRLGITPVP